MWKECGKRDQPILGSSNTSSEAEWATKPGYGDLFPPNQIWRPFPAKPDMADFSRQTGYGGLFTPNPDSAAFSRLTRIWRTFHAKPDMAALSQIELHFPA